MYKFEERERERERERIWKKKIIVIVKELYFHFMSSNMCKSNAHYVNIDLWFGCEMRKYSSFEGSVYHGKTPLIYSISLLRNKDEWLGAYICQFKNVSCGEYWGPSGLPRNEDEWLRSYVYQFKNVSTLLSKFQEIKF